MHTRHLGIANTWKCRFTKQGNYIVVFEWDTVERMREMLAKYHADVRVDHYKDAWGSAPTFPTVRSVPGWKLHIGKKFGEIHLVNNTWGSRTASHEIQHIINAYSSAKEWDMVEDDEKIATIAGVLTRSFWCGYYKCHES
jgi:hypothetical protein